MNFHTTHKYTHYTVGGKWLYHSHTMVASCTLREFDARFLKENWELFVGGRVIGQVLVVYCFGTSFIVPICAHKLAYA